MISPNLVRAAVGDATKKAMAMAREGMERMWPPTRQSAQQHHGLGRIANGLCALATRAQEAVDGFDLDADSR